MDRELKDAMSDMRADLSKEVREQMQDFTPEQRDKVRALVENILNADEDTPTALVRRVGYLTETLDEVRAENEKLRKENANARFDRSDDVARVRTAGSPFGGMRMDVAARGIVIGRVSNSDVNRDRADKITKAVADMEGDVNEIVERNADAVIRRLEDAGITTATPIIEAIRDKGLGRVEKGKGIDTDSNGIGARAQRAILSIQASGAATTGSAAVSTIVDMNFLGDVVLTEEALMPRIPQFPMESPDMRFIKIGNQIWNDVARGIQNTQVNDGDAQVVGMTINAANSLEGSEFITQDMIDDSPAMLEAEINRMLPMVMAEAMDDAILNADSRTAAGDNVNGTAYSPTAAGAAPAFIGWNGIRRMIEAGGNDYSVGGGGKTIGDAGALDSANAEAAMKRLRRALGAASIRPNDFLFVAPFEERMNLRDNLTAYQRLDAVGQLATLVAGDLRQFMTGTIISPEGMTQGATADGKSNSTRVAGTGGSLGYVICLAPSYLRVGIRVAPSMFVRMPADRDPHGVRVGVRARFGFLATGFNHDGTLVAAALKAGRRPMALMGNITR